MANTTTNTMMDMIFSDSDMAFKIVMFNRLRGMNTDAYFEIGGSWIEGVMLWAEHTLESIVHSENHKYHGWTVMLENGNIVRVVVPRWVMEVTPKGWQHAKNLFNKYLRIV